jgi:iron only hydrogenase large subunit-like protein
VQAKQVRNDLSRVKTWLRMGTPIALSLAPSWRSEFCYHEDEMLSRLYACGMQYVSETALGAEEINAQCIAFLTDTPGVWISTACPVVVQLIAKYYPHLRTHLIPVESPMVAHARMLQAVSPSAVKIVFAGPCFAKKGEADRSAGVIDAAITFEELSALLKESADSYTEEDVCRWFPRPAQEGAVYPVDGGMISGIHHNDVSIDADFFAVSGIDNIIEGLEHFNPDAISGTVFIEMQACEGGCINGPGCIEKTSWIHKRIATLRAVQDKAGLTSRASSLKPHNTALDTEICTNEPEDAQLTEVFHSFGKYSEDDMLNCGGCGYDSCRDLAKAILMGKAEPGMCVSHLRALAQKKANALFKAMPSGVVIVDAGMRVVELNHNFARLLQLGDPYLDATADLTGASLARIAPFSQLFEQVMQTGFEVNEREIPLGNSIVKISIFVIEPRRLVGGIVQDVTKPSVAREQTVSKAREVIRKNLDMVQKIAYLLGENAAEVEMTLNSIIEVTGRQSDESELR